VTVAEIGHGIYRANTPELRDRRRAFLNELKATVPIHPVTEATAEIVARFGGEQAARGIIVPLADLLIGACALELGYAVGGFRSRSGNGSAATSGAGKGEAKQNQRATPGRRPSDSGSPESAETFRLSPVFRPRFSPP
jgi:hypothetical protein